MKQVLYHLHTPPPEMAGTEAVLNEITDLQKYIAGNTIFLMNRHSQGFRWLIWLRGLRIIFKIREKEADIDAHIVFHSELFPFLYLGFLRKPIIYTVVSGLGDRPLFPPRSLLKRCKVVVVSNKADQQRLYSQGIKQTAVIRPAMRLSRVVPSDPLPLTPFRILVASAPWTEQQFETKGIRTLLQASQQLDWLHLVFLWRGVLYEEMMNLVAKYEVSEQVEVINQITDVPKLLQMIHAVALIGNTRRHIKAFPRSLMESLVAHRPVILSKCIPMSHYVEQHECGILVEGIQLDDLLAKLQLLRNDYHYLQKRTTNLDMTEFSVETIAAAYRNLREN